MGVTTNAEAFRRAGAVLVGGVNSPVRSFNSVGGTPIFIDHGKGSHITDVEGRSYVDYIQSYGAIILGHADSRITEIATRATERGTTFGTPTLGEVELAERIVAKVPGVEMVRLTSSGTEATMTAIRLARGVTRRQKIIKFEGCYHGHVDSLLAEAGSGAAALGVPSTAGVGNHAVSDTLVYPYNTIPDIDESIAAVIVEPIAANMGLIPPDPGFLAELRARTQKAGGLLIFDEVITGFRVALAGASSLFDIKPDLWCYGKVIGGGFPIGAIAGPSHIMTSLAPLGPVYQAGTLSGNPVATAAGEAVLSLLDETSYLQLEGRAQLLAEGLAKVIGQADVDVQLPRIGGLLGIYFASDPITNFVEAKRSVETGFYPKFFHAMLKRGIALAPGPYEILFPGLAHTVDDIERTIDIASAAAAEARDAWHSRV